MECIMKGKYFRVSIWLLGIVALAVSLVGANLALNTRAGVAAAREENGGGAAQAAPIEGAVCIAHVDVEARITELYPSLPGRVAKVLAREGQALKKGDVIFRMEDRPARYLLTQAEAELRAAKARHSDALKLPKKHQSEVAQQGQAIIAKQNLLSAARHDMTRLQRLVDSKSAPKEDLSAADDRVKAAEAAIKGEEEKLRELGLVDPENDISRAEADVAAKQAQLDNARFALEECNVKAPCDGEVLRLQVSAGEWLGAMPKQSAVQFLPAGPRIVRAEVEQEFANRVKEGQVAEIHDDSKTGPVWHGKVVHISDWYTHRRSIVQEPLQFNDVRTLECIIQIDPHAQMPKIGQRVRVMLGSAAQKQEAAKQ
jgi:multidrug resistance efflux pump